MLLSLHNLQKIVDVPVPHKHCAALVVKTTLKYHNFIQHHEHAYKFLHTIYIECNMIKR